MEKKYFVDVYFYICPECKKQSLEKKYFAVFDKREIGQARMAGLLDYNCSQCGAVHNSKSIMVNGEVTEVSQDEAQNDGIGFESFRA
jgi:rubredoxin